MTMATETNRPVENIKRIRFYLIITNYTNYKKKNKKKYKINKIQKKKKKYLVEHFKQLSRLVAQQIFDVMPENIFNPCNKL